MLLNPLVVVPVVVALITAGWYLSVGGTSSVAQARHGANLLPALDQTPSATPGAPDGGWTVSHSGDAKTSIAEVNGRVTGHGLKLDITRYSSGDVTLTSPPVAIRPGKTYFFKAFTSSTADFALLARRHHADGSTSLEQLPNPLQQPLTSPFAVSNAFSSGDTTSVEYVFRLASAATFQVEDTYLEEADDVRPPPAPSKGQNLIPNPGLAGPPEGPPDLWSPYSSGSSTVTSGAGVDKAGKYLWTRAADYKNGEAKWEYQPIPVSPDRYFAFDVTYQSGCEDDVVAEFELLDGEHTFLNLDTVLPAGEWTSIKEAFQAPPGAKSVVVTLISHGNGTTGVRNYSLTDVTKPGPLRWEKPMVSITFDDGWQSVFDRALPLLNQHGFRSTQYVNASTIETPNYLTAAEVQQLHDAGHEIAAHSYEHVDLTSISTDRLDEELRKSKEALVAAGLPTDDLATPYGRSDAQVDWYASKYFRTVRGTDDGINTRQNLDPHDLKVLYVTDQTTPDQLAGALAETSRINGWLIIVYHQIGTKAETVTGGDPSTITRDALSTQLQLIAKSGIEVEPIAQAFKQLQG